MTMPVYSIGATQEAMALLTALGLPLPKADAVDYAEYVDNGAGELVGQGWLMTTWRFARLTNAEQVILAAFAGLCYISTLEQGGTYGIYSALMVLPPRKPPKAGQLLDYAIEFRGLVAVS